MAERSPSILHRIVWLHLLLLAAIAIAITAAVYFLLNATVNDFEEHNLRDHAASVARYLAWSGRDWTLALPPDLKSLYAQGYGGYALAVVSGDGRVVYTSLANDSPFLRIEPSASPSEFFHQRRNASVYYGLTTRIVRNGKVAWIQIGQNFSNPDVFIDDVVARFLGRIAWFVVPIFTVLLLANILLMRRLLAPIVAASQAAAAIGPDRPQARLRTKGLPREVQPLAQAANQALDRLEAALRAQQEFTADAAHELRTPLAILRTHADTKLGGEMARAFQADIDGMSHIVDQLLELAELEGGAIGVDAIVNLDNLGAEIVGAMAPIALAEGKSLELECGPAPVLVQGNAEMLSRALRNLVENAIRYSPAGQAVEVQIAAPATVRIKDRGPGIELSERAFIFQRFWRRERGARGHAGLGLSIVAKITQLHGGTISITDRAGGGTIFTLMLDKTNPY